MTAKKRREPAVTWLRSTDRISVFVDFAVRQIGAGEHDGLVIKVALAGLMGKDGPVLSRRIRPRFTVPERLLRRAPVCAFATTRVWIDGNDPTGFRFPRIQ